ncbi:SpoIIE family protein phosphatase [Chitinivibrio alkaliphilus]|uniref:Stage II sporulation protein E (SpoIIE) n=1 Tax=Chitinivibrio alkaliphilus ACht1 TaxID=1313304 RepID=U7D801_9BACT|nr:SpoIIE family protein phosphatase [Chitinivibrio alkaliphilus]ERP32068.1 Stage II sporulation protein E (SpoIIE) [Chitinivibrio alkaliphilus ACht1]
MVEHPFIELEYSQHYKHTERIGGDVFIKRRCSTDGSITAVLSDGLGSGVKAHVLANLTAHMGHRFLNGAMDIRQSAEIIMNSLPVCKERRISYATFTMLHMDNRGRANLIEYDTPSLILLRNNRPVTTKPRQIVLHRSTAFKEEVLLHTPLDLHHGDRLVFFSDGVPQSGMGSPRFPLGWRPEAVSEFIVDILHRTPQISARALAEKITQRALSHDRSRAQDDITCASLYVRTPRKTLLVSGPSLKTAEDTRMARTCAEFTGKKIICGGTTARIISRIWEKPLQIQLHNRTRHVPPSSTLEGVDLVTEGILTLSKTVEYLGAYPNIPTATKDPAYALTKLLIESDEVHFLIGTKINEAHQDPSMPVEVGIRRNIITRIIEILEKKHLKQTSLEFI